jgi:hypothetical protein
MTVPHHPANLNAERARTNPIMNTTILKLGTLAVAVAALTKAAQAADLHVPADYPIIQAAVEDASDGDTIHIAAGVYQEQVKIVRKDLTVIGEPGTILRAVPDMDPPSGVDDFPVRCILLIHHSTNVILENLSFEGEHLGAEQGFWFFGALYLSSGGTVENCRFTGFRMSPDNPGDAPYENFALAFINNLPTARLLEGRVVNNTIVDSYQGIYAIGTIERTVLNLVIENNTIQGIGPTPDRTPDINVLSGVQLRQGVTAKVTSNSISGFSYNGSDSPFPFNFGILCNGSDFPDFVPLDPMRFENNTLRDNDVHILSMKGVQHKIIGNRFIGTGESERRIGVWISDAEEDSAALIRENFFEELPVGILAAGEDPVFDTVAGVAHDTQIVDNRFRDVEAPIEIQPTGTAIESGTLVSPFPEPELGIVKSVNLSWPDYYGKDYMLEGAPTPQGPWTEVGAQLELVEGSLQTAVEINDEQQYFRLRLP